MPSTSRSSRPLTPMQQPTKACPVVLRRSLGVDVLAFEHPFGGRQLVKGTIEPGEAPGEAAVRELFEESGLVAQALQDLGTWQSGFEQQVWSFHLCQPARELPERWVHHAKDDGGQDFRFFWHPLLQTPSEGWHEVYLRALLHIRDLIPDKEVPCGSHLPSPSR
jgi:8-oxo-dGTP pyrophosphatase MutT (NUDIX family)